MVGRMAELMTSQQTADALRVHRATVHRWVAKGLLVPAQVIHLDAQGSKVYLFDAERIGELARRSA